MRLSAAQLSALLEGLDWRRVHEARGTPAPVQAELICGQVNQPDIRCRRAAANMVYSRHGDDGRPRFPTILAR